MKKILRKEIFFILAIVGVVGLYFYLRLRHLTLLPVFADEAIYVRWAQVMKFEPTLRFLPLSDGKQPLYMWVLIPFFKIFTDPLYIGRFVSVLTGFGTLVGTFLATQLLFSNKKVSLIAAFFYALTPFSVFFDRMALVDSMLAMFGVWVFLGTLFVAKKLRLDAALITGFFLGGALLTKSPALFFVLMLPSLALFVPLVKRGKFTKRAFPFVKFVGLLLVILVIGYGMYNILRLGPNFQLLGQRNQDYVYSLNHILTSPLDPFKGYMERSFNYFWLMGPSVFIILSLIGFLLNIKKKFRQTIVLAIWAMGPLLIVCEYTQVLTARYILFTVPFFVILAASSFLTKSLITKKLLVIGLLFFVAHAFYIDNLLVTNIDAAQLPRTERSGYLEEWTAGTGIKETADLILQEHQQNPDEKIIVGTEGYFGTLPDGLEIYLNQIPNVTVIGVGLGHSEVPKKLLDAKAAGNKTYYVFNNIRFYGKEDELGMKLVAAYPKAVQPNGKRQTLLFYEITKDALSLNPEAQ